MLPQISLGDYDGLNGFGTSTMGDVINQRYDRRSVCRGALAVSMIRDPQRYSARVRRRPRHRASRSRK